MREILFRGQDKKGNWHYGDLVHEAFDGISKNIAVGIRKPNCYPVEVIPETVGQFTGLTDKNGKKIFEGDIIRCEYFKLRVGNNLGVYEIDEELIGTIYFDGLSLCVGEIKSKKWEEYTGYESGDGNTRFIHLGDVYEGSMGLDYQIEVIGNIHDNPEL